MFNWREFQQFASSSSTAKLKSYRTALKQLVRDKPMLRGCWQKYSDNPQLVVNLFHKVMRESLEGIKSGIFEEKKMLGAREKVVEWEEFQSNQKGPTGPVVLKAIYEKVINPLKSSTRFEFSNETKKKIDLAFETLSEFFVSSLKEKGIAKVDPSNINFKEEWSKLPNLTVRGFPYNNIGKDSDEEIASKGGSTLDEAIRYFNTNSQIICYTGWRIQGAPSPGPAKVRAVMIPDVYYQYINVGLYKTTMSILRETRPFIGWLHPDEMAKQITDIQKEAKKLDISFIPLDFSAFDRNVNWYFRQKANDFMVSLFKEGTLSEYQTIWRNKNRQQYLILPVLNGYTVLDVDNQLLSGVINTQQDGSIINLCLQTLIAKGLGFEPFLQFSAALGDDVILPVPNSLLNEEGYEKLLEKINNIVSEFGFMTHTKKAYPSASYTFLQKISDVDNGLLVQGSVLRALSSLFFKERRTTKIEGIENIYALEIIAMISIMNNGFGKGEYNYSRAWEPYIRQWIKHDDYLKRALHRAQINNQTPHQFFVQLIEDTGLDIDKILFFEGKLAYDHTGTKDKLESSDYGVTFPAIPLIFSVWKQVSDLFPLSQIRKKFDQYISFEKESEFLVQD